MATIRTASGTRFKLTNDRMIETMDLDPFFAYRLSLRKALELNAKHPGIADVKYFWFLGEEDELHEGNGWLREGKTQRNKKFLSIGCMRFVGKERLKLIKWAKTKAKATRGNE